MHAVVVTRVRGLTRELGYREGPRRDAEPPREEIARALAELTGRDEADWRMRLGQPLPWMVAMEPDVERASALVMALRRRGLGAVACDQEVARAWAPRGHTTLVLHEAELGFVEDPRRIPYDAIRALVHAMLDSETSTETTENVTVAVNARASRHTMPVSRYRRERSRSRALYLVLGADVSDLRLGQGAVRLASPDGGVMMASTSIARFQQAIEAIGAKTPGAWRDERLLKARRGRSGLSTHRDGVTHTTSNDRETELVAHAIGVALLEGQIDPEPS